MSKAKSKLEIISDSALEAIKKYLNDNKELKDPQKGHSGLIDRLKEMEKAYKEKTKLPPPDYGSFLPPTLGLEQKEYVPLTPEEILKKAESELLPSYQINVEKETAAAQKKLSGIEEKRKKAETSENAEKQNLDAALEELLKRQQYSVINRGVVNSSINAEGKRNINEYGAREFLRIESEYDAVYRGLKAEEDYLNLSYQNALKSYDLKYALDLEKRLSALQLAEEKRLKEIEAYNRKLEEQEAAYQKQRDAEIKKREEKRTRLEELMKRANAQSPGFSEAEGAEYEKRFDTAAQFYRSLDKETAETLFLESAEELKELLGNEYFNRLYLELYRGV